MADILQTGLSGLIAFQRALATTGNNVANANTDGYSRQRVQLVTQPPQGYGYGFVGTGVKVSTIQRVVDQFGINQLRTANGTFGQVDTLNTYANQVDDLVGNPNTGIASSLQSFFGAWHDLANDPASASARQVLISQAQSLTQRFNSADQTLNSLQNDVNNNVVSTVTQINGLASSIAKLNQDIVAGNAGFNQPPNDLLDQRDQLLGQLSKLTNTTVLENDDGSVNVLIGSGQSLVLRTTVLTLGTQRNAFDPSQIDVTYQGNGNVNQTITSSLQSSGGGSLGGLLNVRSQLIDPVRNTLGQIATAVATTVNAQQHQGLTATGVLGGDLFSIDPPQALPDNANTGSGSATVSISDISQLTSDDYYLSYNGTNYSLARAKDGQAVTLTGAGTAGSPFTAAGLSIVVAGAPAAGDRILIRPTRLGAATLQVATTDPNAIAAAGPIRTAAATTNTGNATVSSGTVLNAGNAALLNPVSIQFVTATTYSVNGGAAVAYTPGSNIDVNGWRVQINGTPAIGDTFTVRSNAGGTGDNRNALAIAQLQNQGVLNSGTTSISDAFNALVGQVGTQAQQASVNRDAQSAIVSQAEQQVQATSGVNLDAEAANMLRWQQAYQASAQTMVVANSLFQTLMTLLSR